MGRVFLIQFDQTPDIEFYVCRKCQTHIALEQERTSLHADDNGLNGAVFRKAINWHTLEAESNRRVGNYVVEEIYCTNCGNPLGFQFIEVPNDVVVKEKHLLLHGSKVLFRNADGIVLIEDEVDDDH